MNLLLFDNCVLISIKPEWVDLIASGKKTIEVRKNFPDLRTPFKVYIYCTKGSSPKDQIWFAENDEDGNYIGDYLANGNVIGEFMCNEIIEWTRDEYGTNCYDISDDDFEATCITLMDDFWEYGKGKTLYGWRINDLKIYDRPIPVTKFKQTKVVRGYHKKPCDPNKKIDIEWLLNGKRLKVNHLTGAPQSWCYVDKMRGIRYG